MSEEKKDDKKIHTLSLDWEYAGRVSRVDDVFVEDYEGTVKGKMKVQLVIGAVMASVMALSLIVFGTDYMLDNGFILLPIFTGIAAAAALPFGLNNARKYWIRRQVEQNLPVPSWAISSTNRFGLQVALLIRKVNRLFNRWNRYRSLCEAGYCDPMTDEDEAYEHLQNLRKEVVRHRKAADIFIQMMDAGDFDAVSADDLVHVHLEAVRETQVRLQDQMNGITHHLSAPLHAELQAAALDRELQEGVVQGAASAAKKNLAGALAQKVSQ